MNIIVIAIVCFGFYFLFSKGSSKRKKGEKKRAIGIKKINEAESIKDIVMSVNYGRIYPFYTRRKIKSIVQDAMKMHTNPTQFEQNVQMQEMIGGLRSLNMPIINDYVESVSVNGNKDGLVRSVTIKIKNFETNIIPLFEEMVVKFGKPMSISKEFIIWRESFMVINIYLIDGSLSVLDENMFNAKY